MKSSTGRKVCLPELWVGQYLGRPLSFSNKVQASWRTRDQGNGIFLSNSPCILYRFWHSNGLLPSCNIKIVPCYLYLTQSMILAWYLEAVQHKGNFYHMKIAICICAWKALNRMLAISVCIKVDGHNWLCLQEGAAGWISASFGCNSKTSHIAATLRLYGSSNCWKLSCFCYDNRYGSFFKSHILGCPTIVSMDPELNRYILMNEAKGLVPGYPQSMLDILGKSNIAAVHGSAHKHMRGALLSLISPTVIREHLCPTIDEFMRSHLSNWGDSVIDIQQKTKEVCPNSCERQICL